MRDVSTIWTGIRCESVMENGRKWPRALFVLKAYRPSHQTISDFYIYLNVVFDLKGG